MDQKGLEKKQGDEIVAAEEKIYLKQVHLKGQTPDVSNEQPKKMVKMSEILQTPGLSPSKTTQNL